MNDQHVTLVALGAAARAGRQQVGLFRYWRHAGRSIRKISAGRAVGTIGS
jgi:hypothetical protein